MTHRDAKKATRERARQLALFGSVASVVVLLKTAAETFADPEVGTRKVQISAERVIRACDAAIVSISDDFLEEGTEGKRIVKDSILKGVGRISDLFVKKAAARLERRQMYCAEFVGARVMACHYALETMSRRHRLGKKFQKLDGVATTFLAMLLKGLDQHEAVMFAIAEDFQAEAFVP